MKADVYEYRNWEQNSAVVFIHGFAGDIEKTWGKFPEYLMNNQEIKNSDIFSIGYPSSLFAPEWKRMWSAFPSIQTLANSLKTKISHPPFDQYEKVSFIAHSMGGLIVQRAILDTPKILKKIECLFLFGTPSNGLLKASAFRTIFRKRQVRDMSIDGDFITDLRREWNEIVGFNAKKFHFRAIAGEKDEFVESRSCHGPFPKNVRETIPGNHLEIVKPDSPSHLAVQIVVKGLRQKRTSAGSSKQKNSDKEDENGSASLRGGNQGEIDAANSPPCKDALPLNLDSMPDTDSILFGRDEELSLLDEAWENHATKLLVFVAMGGVGKTSLVNSWLHNRMSPDDFRGADRVYAWSFYSQGAAESRQASADRFMVDALSWFGDANPDEGAPAEKGRRLVELVKKQKTLMVLDGLEPVQHPPGPQEGKIKDEGLRILLRGLAVQNPGLCVITTRLAVDDLKTFVRSSVIQKELEHLSDEAGVMLLGHLGVTGSNGEMLIAVEEFDGHALALTLLGTYLKKVHGGNIQQRDKIERLAYPDSSHGKHARWVMESYEKWLEGTETGRRQLGILRIMGLFDRPAPKGAIDAVLADSAIEGLTEELQRISAADWGFALADLRELRLILKQDECEKENSLDCHPLIREHFSEKLKNEKPEAWKQAHSRLYEYFKNLPEKELPDTLEEMEPLFAAVGHGCKAGLHQEALDDVYWERIRRKEDAYSVHKLGAFGSDLTAVSNFFDILWSKPARGLTAFWDAAVLNWAGFRLRALGRLQEATQPMQVGVRAFIQQKEWTEAAISASSLSELYLTLGNVKNAVDYGRQSMDFADRSEDEFWKEASRTTLADALHQAGELTEAETIFRDAESMPKRPWPEYHFLFSISGFQFCDLLLSLKQYEDVVERSEHGIKIAQGENWLLDIALDTLSLGRSYLLQALAENSDDFTHAETFLNRAVTGLREAGYQDYLSRGILARAALFRAKKEFEKARTDLNEAHEIAEYGEMKLFLTDYHLEACRLCFAEEKGDEAKEHLQKAKDLIAETGYKRRLRDVEEIGTMIK